MTRYLVPLVAFAILIPVLMIGLTRDPRELPSPLWQQAAPQFELPSLLALVADLASTDVGRQRIESLQPLGSPEQLRARRQCYDGARVLLEEQALVPSMGLPLIPLLETLRQSDAGLDGTEIRVRGGGAFLKYRWPHESRLAFAYMGGGLGVNRVRRQRLITDVFEHNHQLALHFILMGMEKHLMKGRLKLLFEVRWVIGEEEDATALRSAVGFGINFGKP